ncbi:MAG: sensor histidine kinase, partial [Tumebacillaceae bacterium]
LLCGAYYMEPGWAAWKYPYVLVATFVFTINHFLLKVVGRHYLWLVAVDFVLGTGFGLVFLGSGNLYMLFYGLVCVTLMLLTDDKRVKTGAGALILLGLSSVLVCESLYGEGPIDWLGWLLDLGFVVFASLVGSLIRHYQVSRRQIQRLYQELDESHQALREAHDQLSGYARQVEALTATRERNQIAREIHDTVGHTMTALLVQLQAGRKLQDRDPEKSRETLLRCEDLARSALQEVRLSVRAIRDEDGPEASLIDALRKLLSDFSEMSDMAAHLHVQGHPGVIGQALQPALYRIVQESLTNAKRHGSAGNASVTLTCTDQKVTLEIGDDGIGSGEIAPGFGLINMRERVEEQGGTIQFASEAGRGFCVSVTFPLQQQTWRFGGRGA